MIEEVSVGQYNFIDLDRTGGKIIQKNNNVIIVDGSNSVKKFLDDCNMLSAMHIINIHYNIADSKHIQGEKKLS